MWTVFCPQVQSFLETVVSQRLHIMPAVFVYNIKPHILQRLANNMECVQIVCVSVCVVIHRGQAEKEGRGHCLSRGGGVE